MFQTILGAGHHVYADKSDIFNETVNAVCKFSDECSDVDESSIKTSAQPLERRSQEKHLEVLDPSPDNKLLPSSPAEDKIDTKTNQPS